MKKDDLKFETIKKKLLKLQALAEKGCGGEAENAKRLLEKLCEEYGIKLEDIFDQDKKNSYVFKIGRGQLFFKLFHHCYYYVTGNSTIKYWQISNSEISLDLTAYEFAEISNLFNWHKSNFKKDLEKTQQLVLEAYIEKHNIYSHNDNSDENDEEKEEENKPLDMAHLHAILAMMGELNDNSYRPMIE